MKTPHRFAIWFICASMLSFHSALAQFTQQGPKLVPAGAMNYTAMGFSSSLSADGNTAIVGGFNDNDSVGAAWVFTRNGGVWAQYGTKLVGAGSIGYAQQGYSVCLSADGNTAILGGPGDNATAGAAWVFAKSGGVWSQQGSKLVGAGAVGNAQQGYSVALSADGNTAVVGGFRDSGSAGATWVWTRSAGIWAQQGPKLVGSGVVGNGSQGFSVSLSADGNTAIAGGLGDNNGAGAAWVFTRSGGVWTQQGSKLVGSGAVGNAHQGSSVSLSADGNTALIAGPNDNTNTSTGATWVWISAGGVWTQQGNKLVVVGTPHSWTVRGSSVSLSGDGNTAIIGGPFDDVVVIGNCFCTNGAAWVFRRSGGVWNQSETTLVGLDSLGAAQGTSVSLSFDGSTALIGAGRFYFPGAAWVFIMDPAALPTVSLWALAALAATLAFLGIVKARN